MSELSKQLTCVPTGRRVAEYPALASVCEVTDDLRSIPFEDATEYKIEARVGATMVARNSKELEYVIPRVKAIIVEKMFGEFRVPLLDIKRALHNREFDEADKLLEKVFDSMFSVR